jgi:hypothetical protein
MLRRRRKRDSDEDRERESEGDGAYNGILERELGEWRRVWQLQVCSFELRLALFQLVLLLKTMRRRGNNVKKGVQFNLMVVGELSVLFPIVPRPLALCSCPPNAMLTVVKVPRALGAPPLSTPSASPRS